MEVTCGYRFSYTAIACITVGKCSHFLQGYEYLSLKINAIEFMAPLSQGLWFGKPVSFIDGFRTQGRRYGKKEKGEWKEKMRHAKDKL